MHTLNILRSFAFGLAAVFCAFDVALSQEAPPAGEPGRKPIHIWSDGTRLSGDLFFPPGFQEDQKYPAIVLCHGWGGVRAHLARGTAPRFARAGYIVLTFDYRGWGDSDSRLVLKERTGEPDSSGIGAARVQFIRELVDPFDQVEDIRAAIAYLEGEPAVDASRIGLWGTSFGGGHVIFVAAHDDRVKCVVAQAAAMDARIGLERPGPDGTPMIEVAKTERIRRARGELEPLPQKVHEVPGLRGTPHLERFLDYVPAEHASRVKVPVCIIDAEKEELFDIKQHGERVYKAVKGRVPASYVLIPGITHYGVYTEAFDECTRIAVDWFDKHLKPKGN
jgi:hypothetical protein